MPLVYPLLVYLLGRALWIGFRGGEGLRPIWSPSWLLIAALFLLGFRVGLNMADSGAIDVGYAGVVGADRIAHGEQLYDNFPEDVSKGTPTARSTTTPTSPSSGSGPGRDRGTTCPRRTAPRSSSTSPPSPCSSCSATASAPGRRAASSRATLAFGWAAYPYTAYVLESNSNDSLVAMLLVATLLVLAAPDCSRSLRRACDPDEVRASAACPDADDLPAAGRELLRSWGPRVARIERGAEDVPARSAPLSSVTGPVATRLRSSVTGPAVGRFVLAFFAVTVAAMLWPAITPGLHTFYDRTIGYQAHRNSPFSIWGQVPGLEPLRVAILVGVGLLAIAFAFRPRRKTLTQVAALGAALLIGVAAHRRALVLPLHRLVLPAAAGRAGHRC